MSKKAFDKIAAGLNDALDIARSSSGTSELLKRIEDEWLGVVELYSGPLRCDFTITELSTIAAALRGEVMTDTRSINAAAPSSSETCPLCGGNDLIRGVRYAKYSDTKDDAVRCQACDCNFPLKAWNARHVAQQPLDREQIAALLYMTRYPTMTWLQAGLWETKAAYSQADAILSLVSSTDGGTP